MTNTETTKRPARTSRMDGMYANAGATRGQSLPLYRCNTCGSLVVWAESKRTGRKYLCDTMASGSEVREAYIYRADRPHNCEAVQARRRFDAWTGKTAAWVLNDLLCAIELAMYDIVKWLTVPAVG